MKALFKLLRYSGLPWLFREWVQRDKVTILMFHDINKNVARQSFEYLSRHYNLISLQDYRKALAENNTHLLPKKSMVITFDDGHKQNYEILSVLREFEVPATIFLCSGIVDSHRHYWFKSNRTGITTDRLKQIPNKERLTILAESGFRQEETYEERQALTRQEIQEMKPFIDFQAHTVFHPILPQCDDEESWFEIADCKQQLESNLQLEINAFAYPNGDYSTREVSYLQKAGYDLAVTVDLGLNTIKSNPYQLKRLSSNDTADINELIVKSSGLWAMIINLLKKRGNNKI